MKIASVSVAVGLAVVAAVLLASANGSAQDRGGPSVFVTNTPLPVTGTVELAGAGTPAQVVLKGAFSDGSVNLGDTILGPRSYTIPAGFSRFLMKHVACEAILVSGHKVQIFLEASVESPSVGGQESLVELIPDNEIFGALPQPRQVANAETHAFLGITTPGGPTTGDTLFLQAQRDTTAGTGGVTCLVAGELFQ